MTQENAKQVGATLKWTSGGTKSILLHPLSTLSLTGLSPRDRSSAKLDSFYRLVVIVGNKILQRFSKIKYPCCLKSFSNTCLFSTKFLKFCIFPLLKNKLISSKEHRLICSFKGRNPKVFKLRQMYSSQSTSGAIKVSMCPILNDNDKGHCMISILAFHFAFRFFAGFILRKG